MVMSGRVVATVTITSALAITTLTASAAGSPARATAATTEIASISTDGTQGDHISGRFAGPAISGDGRVVAFDSVATTLVPGDTNKDDDVFVRDRNTGTTERVSVSTAGEQGNDSSGRPSVDGDGNLVAFDSNARNLVDHDTNQQMDVFVRDRAAGTTERISVSVGRGSRATGPATARPSVTTAATWPSSRRPPTWSPDDTNGTNDVFVRDLVAGTTELESVSSDGIIGNSSSTGVGISADGRWVSFSSFANNLVRATRTIRSTCSCTTGRPAHPAGQPELGRGDRRPAQLLSNVSADGRYVAFYSNADNLVTDDTNGRSDGFVRDTVAGTTERFSVGNEEQEGDGNTPEPGVRGFTASSPDITPDGRFVAFFSSSANLVAGDTNTCPPNFDQFPGNAPTRSCATAWRARPCA